MRKQYHFRKIENDTYIWDVDNLIALTKSFKVKEILLSEIKELNEPYWYPDSHPTTQDIINHMLLIQEADLSYPIIICSQGRIMDGMHRVGKAKILGKDKICAVQFDKDPQPDYVNVDENDLIYDDLLWKIYLATDDTEDFAYTVLFLISIILGSIKSKPKF